MTDEEYAAWLVHPASMRHVLVEVGVRVAGVEMTRYLCTRGYVTGAGETPANTAYMPVVIGGIQYTEQISLTQEASLSFGDVELDNSDGALDSWLTDIWDNRPIQAYIGDPRWPRSDFRLIFDGTVGNPGIDSRSRETINIKIFDKLQRLNTPITDEKLGGSTPNKDVVIPLLFGEAHNITPLLTDPNIPEYQVHLDRIEEIAEVRVNGKPVAFTPNLIDGKFTLADEPFGAVTVEAQGDRPSAYYNTISKLVQRIVTGYGKASDRFDSGDLDAVNLAAFDSAHTQPVGLYVAERMNVLVACQKLAASVGAQLLMSRTGLLRLFQIDLPPIGTPTVIKASQMVERTLRPVLRTTVVAAIKIAYCEAWTVQPGLLTTIPEEHKDLFAKQWLTVTASNGTTQTVYKLNTEPVAQETCLLVEADAIAEAERRRDLWSEQHTIYEFEGWSEMLLLELGQGVTLYNSRYGMSGGVLGLVVSLTPNWITGHVIVGVLV